MLVARVASVVIWIRGHRPRFARPPRIPTVCRRTFGEGDFCVIPTVCHGHPVQILLLSISLEQAQIRLFVKVFCGERGIRTPETLLEFTRFPGVPLQPLEHLSFASATSYITTLLDAIHLSTRKGTKIFTNYKIYNVQFAFFLLFSLIFHKFITKSSFALAVVTSFMYSGEQLYTSAKRSATYRIQRLSFRFPR